MVDRLRHRGPDDEGIGIVDDGTSPRAIFGYTRLAIVDLSPAGHQPMASRDRRHWISYNGEVYNFRQLRDELSDSREPWHSTGDTEVVLRAYQRWGPACLDRFRGMFAFGIFDSTRGGVGQPVEADRPGPLFLARDRFGIKPLYYFEGDGVFVFASEVRALLASGLVPRRLDLEALDQFLAYQAVPAPRTLIQGVRQLLPGHWLSVSSSGAVTTHPYWDLPSAAKDGSTVDGEPAARRRVAELLREAVSLHLVSDVPVGIFLSGGIDSSAITALVREAGQVPRTFSVGFRETLFDESRWARLVATRFQTDHTEILLGEDEIHEQLPLALAAMDQPSGDAVNTYVVSGAVHRSGMKVALSGLGGDELFAGYSTFARLARAERFLGAWTRLPRGSRQSIADALRGLASFSPASAKLVDILGSDGSLAEVYPLLRQVFSVAQRRELLAAPSAIAADGSKDPYASLLRASSRKPLADHFLSEISFAETRTYMHDVLLRDADQMSMAHGLEVRVPLLDHVLAEYVVGLSDRFKQPGQVPKRLLVESLNGLLPDEIVRRPKRGFVLPMAEWMRGPLRDYCEAHLGPGRLGARGILRPAALSSLWTRFLAGDRRVSWSRVWLLVALEEWLATNLDALAFS